MSWRTAVPALLATIVLAAFAIGVAIQALPTPWEGESGGAEARTIILEDPLLGEAGEE